jgi:DUF1365 family protein
MEQYKPYYRPGKPLRILKLVNFDKPAISLSFFSKHKYSIERNVTHGEVMLHLKNYRDELLNKSLMQQLSAGQQTELKQADQLLRTIRDHPMPTRPVCRITYHYYRYWYCTYRYFDDPDQTKTTTSSEHF